MSRHRSVNYRKVHFLLERRQRKPAAPFVRFEPSAESEEPDFSLAPAVVPPADELSGRLARLAVAEPKPEIAGTAFESAFSLKELMLLVTFAAVGLSGLHWLPPRLYAGMAGLAALVGLAWLSILKPSRAVIHLAWWVTLVIYILSAALALHR